MGLSNVGYLLRQGVKNVWLNRLLSVASVGVLTVCFLLIGTATLFSFNMGSFVHEVEKKNELVVFLEDDMVKTVKHRLEKIKNVAKLRFVSKKEALEMQFSKLDKGGELFNELSQSNPLPDSYRVSLHNVSEMKKTVKKIEKIKGVEGVRAPDDVAKVISQMKSTVKYAGYIIVGFLLLVSLFIIATTIKMTIYDRRREINIMKFVGASNTFIRIPFVVEGVVLGLLAAFLAYGVLYLGYSYMLDIMKEFDVEVGPMVREGIVPFAEVGGWLIAGFVGVGSLIGAFGSMFFVRKHLRV
ncbi:MAG: permease-like cell division protein FtsX [Oscillospiraceae bacterium]|nr:permease-like cell division protein FtsX [Oscillospiraceae bacterium]